MHVAQLLLKLQYQPFPTYRRVLTHLQQTTFENIVTKGEIAQNKQFLLLPQRFQPFSVIKPSLSEIFQKNSRCFQSCQLQMWERVNVTVHVFQRFQV